jgi:outer membrane protein OmpT
MKKTLLALAVVAAAGSVNAAELMNTGTVSVTTDADFTVSLTDGPFNEGKPAISYDGAEIAFGAESVINDNWTAFLNYGLEMEYGGDVVSKDIVAGFKFYNNHQIEFGKTEHVLDLGSNKLEDLGLDISNSELPSTEDLIVYMYTGENFGAGISYELSGAIEGAQEEGVAVYLDGNIGGLYLRGDYGMGEDDAAEYSVYGVRGDYAWDMASLGLSYVGSSKDFDGADSTDVSLIDAWVGFSAGLDWSLGLQYITADDSTNSADGSLYYLGTSYSLNDVVSVYGEIAYGDTEGSLDLDVPGGVTLGDNDGFGYSIGMKMAF